MQDFNVTEVGSNKEALKAKLDNHHEVPASIRSTLFEAIDACVNTGTGENYTGVVTGTFTKDSIAVSLDVSLA